MTRLSVVGGTDRETPPGHTPGPWKAVTTYRCDLGYVSVQPVTADPVRDRPLLMASGAYHIAQLYHSRDPLRIKLNEANARMMASAPDLLEALTAMLDAADRYAGKPTESYLAVFKLRDKARAAIAKATTP